MAKKKKATKKAAKKATKKKATKKKQFLLYPLGTKKPLAKPGVFYFQHLQ